MAHSNSEIGWGMCIVQQEILQNPASKGYRPKIWKSRGRGQLAESKHREGCVERKLSDIEVLAQKHIQVHFDIQKKLRG